MTAIGGHFMFDDDQETPNTLNCAFEYDLPNGKRSMLEFEVRHWITNDESEIGARQAIPNPWRMPPILAWDLRRERTMRSATSFTDPKVTSRLGDGDGPENYKTWLGKEQTPGEQVTTATTNRATSANFIDAVISRKKEDLHAPIEEGHLSCGLIHLANASYRLGRTVNFNPQTEEVIGDEEAAVLVRDGDRGYRAPFVVPEEV